MKPQFLRFILFSLLLVLPLAGAEATSDGELVGTPTPLRNVPAEVAAIADGKMVAYYMPAIRGGQTIATAMLFIPKGPAPAGGWPLDPSSPRETYAPAYADSVVDLAKTTGSPVVNIAPIIDCVTGAICQFTMNMSIGIAVSRAIC